MSCGIAFCQFCFKEWSETEVKWLINVIMSLINVIIVLIDWCYWSLHMICQMKLVHGETVFRDLFL